MCCSAGVTPLRRRDERALRLLTLLPEREREVLTLRFLRGYNAADIGHALGLSPGNVRVLQFRALRRAATLLLDPEHQEGER
jgi:RNA polymerase sigma factor (sigma-70 family)